MDLTSSAGKMTINIIKVVAQFKRYLLIERMQAVIAKGRKPRRPVAL